jgi:Arylsulfatase A and related enzymes
MREHDTPSASAPSAASSSTAPSGSARSGCTRRDFLKRGALAAAGATFGTQFLGLLSPSARADNSPPLPRNLLIILTDQERPVMWFPEGWEAANLPNLARLKANGLTFNRAFCATACCTPSRNTFFTGLFPAQHGSPDTLSDVAPQNLIEHQLDPSLPNLATCLKEAGYDVIYKGKWHLSTPVVGPDGTLISDDISRYGFDGWDAPDAGTTMAGRGGGTPDNDRRFVDDAIAFLEHRLAHPSPRPFCLIVSLINPHDIVAYPLSYRFLGYDDSAFAPTTPPISLPPTEAENLLANKKPAAHAHFVAATAGIIPVPTPEIRLNYVNFYANRMRDVDAQIGRLLAVFDDHGEAGRSLLDDTLIVRTSDHGEMAMCHGHMRQKCFVTYEEVLRVPLVWSNPRLFPAPRTTDALVSHVDFLPTVCSLVGVPGWQGKGFQGVDYSGVVLDPDSPPPQDHVLFTYDDIYAGQSREDYPGGVVPAPNRIHAIRTADFKYARYFDADGVAPDQEEFYDLRPEGGDFDVTHQLPLELNNLSEWAADNFPNPPALTTEQTLARASLKSTLAAAVATRLQPRPPASAAAPRDLKIEVVRWSDGAGSHTHAQLTFYSQVGTRYQLQRSTDLVAWDDVDDPIPGNNGPVLRHYELSGPRVFYRIRWEPVPAA